MDSLTLMRLEFEEMRDLLKGRRRTEARWQRSDGSWWERGPNGKPRRVREGKPAKADTSAAAAPSGDAHPAQDQAPAGGSSAGTDSPAASMSSHHVMHVLHTAMNDRHISVPLSEQLDINRAHHAAVSKTLRAIPLAHIRSLGAPERAMIGKMIQFMLDTNEQKKLLQRWDPHRRVRSDEVHRLGSDLVKLVQGEAEPSAEPARSRNR